MPTHELEKLSEIYLSQKDISPATVKTYKITFKHYIKYLKDEKITYAKTSDVIKYREGRRGLGDSAPYIYIQLCALKGLYQYLETNQGRLKISEVYLFNIMAGIKNDRIRYHINKPILTLAEAKHLILHTQKGRKSIWHYRDHAIIFLMLTAGLRSCEVIQAKRADYQELDGRRLLSVGSNGNPKTGQFVSVAPGVAQAIDEYLARRKDNNPYLFITTKNVSPAGCLSRTFFKDMFHRVLKDCGLDGLGITPHALRHTAGIMNLMRGGSVEATQSLLRHADIASTLVYKDYLERLSDHTELAIERFILKEEDDDLYTAIIRYLES